MIKHFTYSFMGSSQMNENEKMNNLLHFLDSALLQAFEGPIPSESTSEVASDGSSELIDKALICGIYSFMIIHLTHAQTEMVNYYADNSLLIRVLYAILKFSPAGVMLNDQKEQRRQQIEQEIKEIHI